MPDEQFSDEKILVRDVLLRSSGMVDQAEIHIAVDGKESLEEVEMLSLKIQLVISSQFPSIERVLVIPHPYSVSETRVTSRMDRFRSIKLKRPSYMNRNINKQDENTR